MFNFFSVLSTCCLKDCGARAFTRCISLFKISKITLVLTGMWLRSPAAKRHKLSLKLLDLKSTRTHGV